MKNLIFLLGMAFAINSFAQTNQINSTGNVGIGTTNPTKELEVNGDTKITGSVEMDSIVIIKDSIIVDRDAHVKENAKVDGKLKVLGTSKFQEKAIFNNKVVMNNLTLPGANFSILNDGNLILQNANGRLFKMPINTIGEIIYNPTIPCFSDINGNTLPIWKNGLGKMYLECPGNLGLGTTDPQYRLHVIGNGYFSQNTYIKKHLFVDGYIKVGTSSIYIGSINQNTGSNNNIYSTNGDLFIQTPGTGQPYNTWINALGGKVTIGNTNLNGSGNPSTILEVAGTTRACKFIAQANSWCDYVFDKDYKLMPLSELKSFINNYKHLPGVPSEQDVIEQDVDLLEMDKILLKKVEEMTLYLIELKEENDKLKKEVELLKTELQNQ